MTYLNAIAATPDPTQVRQRLDRLVEAGATLTPEAAGPLVGVLSNSRFLATHLARWPADVGVLDANLDRPLRRETLFTWYAELLAEVGDVERALRRLKYRAFTRITARDVAQHAAVADTCKELSEVAEVTLDLAYRHALAVESERSGPPLDSAGAPIPFTVIGMGKLGGRELNYSSDVDLIYFYGTDDGAAGDLTPNAFFCRVGEHMGRLMSRTSDEGIVFRVDLDLRPEGRGGPMCNALASAERYYEAWGRTWERLAWLRARPVAGDLKLGARLLQRLSPWIYRRSLDLGTFEAIRDLKSQIAGGRLALVARGHAAGVDVKLDPGGIRALEFLVHSLQLVHAGRDVTLRDPSTLGALDRLVAAGHLPDGDRDALAEAYLLLRRVEHRVQMDEERQTHRLPKGEALTRLAARMGVPTSAALLVQINERREQVALMFDALMGAGEAADEPADALARSILSGEPGRREALLVEAGFADPRQAQHLLDVAGRHPASPFSPRGGEVTQGLGVRLLADTIRSAEPDRALTHLAAFASRARSWSFDYRVLAKKPQMARLLVSVLASSDLLAQGLLREPSLVQVLGQRDPWHGEDLGARLTAATEGSDIEATLETVARYKQRWTLEIGLADIAGELDAEAVEQALSDVAEACLALVLSRARAEVAARFGAPPARARPAIVALGKLGGRELSYGSDLDVVFLYAAPPEGDDDAEDDADIEGALRISPLEWFTRVAQRTISLLGLPTRAGPLYAVDTRLRPGGRQGTLVTRVSRYRSYHLTSAAPWERLALVRARPVAGPPALLAQVSALIEHLVYEREPPPELRQYARRIRHRMEVEVAREGPGRYNPKTGRGGLVDIEFVVQTLQIEHGGAHHEVRTTSTLRGLQALHEAGLLAEAEGLADAWRFLRRLDHRLRVVRGQARPELRADPLTLDRLARRMGYQTDPLRPADGSPGAQLMSDYRRRTEWVRDRLNELLGPT